MQIKKTATLRFVFIFSLVIVLMVSAYIFLVPFVAYENTLAIQIPQHVLDQVQKRQEKYIPGNQISVFVKEAAVSNQDKRFYSNSGVDVLANLRALSIAVVTGKIQGASTITEQLAKNVYYHDKDTLRTDIKTKLLALFITLHFPKDKILEMYLNDIYYGKGAYGISQAATIYFHTTPAKLSLIQSAYLIALINAPSYLSSHTTQAYQVTKTVLQEMDKNGYISNEQEINSSKSVYASFAGK